MRVMGLGLRFARGEAHRHEEVLRGHADGLARVHVVRDLPRACAHNVLGGARGRVQWRAHCARNARNAHTGACAGIVCVAVRAARSPSA